MLNNLNRKQVNCSYNSYNKKTVELLADEKKVDMLICTSYIIMISLLIMFFKKKIESIISFNTVLPKSMTIIINIVIIFFIIKLFNNFMKNYLNDLGIASKLSNFIFSRFYTLKGNALTKIDLKIIKKRDKNLYHCITTKKCRNYCYNVSFELLNCLKKGEIKFLAIKLLDHEAKIYNAKYTLHAIYIKEGWCFDTFTLKQYLVSNLIDMYEAKEFMTFSYKDIEGKTYNDFSIGIKPLIKDWCIKNDCYQKIA